MLLSVFHPKIIQISLEPVLGRQAGITEIPPFIFPLMQAAVIVHLHIIFYDKWYDSIVQALLKEDQSPHAAVSILKGMD